MTTQSGPTPSEDDAAAHMAPAISIIVPAYGVTTMLADALDSLIAQDRSDWEAIVIDDGDPQVADHVAPYLADPRIHFVQTDNAGLATARNRAIAHARAPLIALLDGDDVYEPDYVSTMVAAIEASPAIGLVSCDATYFGADRAGERFSAYCPQVAPATLDAVLRRRFNVFIAATMRRDAIAGIGGFDTRLRSVEDLDAWLKILEAGWQLAYVPRPLARYRRRAGQMSSNVKVMLESARTVFEQARARLGTRPEAAAAADMSASVAREMVAAEGFACIRDGQARKGVAMLVDAGVGNRGLHWRAALMIARAAPWLARPFLRWRGNI